jgi:hypothetical protein
MELPESFGYAQRQRLQYIESVAYWEGMVDRPRVSRIFELSENHITKDFTIYRKAFPDNLAYDPSARAYRPGRDFEPKIASGSGEEYLAMLRAFQESKSATLLPPIGNGVTTVGLPIPSGTINPKVLREMTRALSQRMGLRISYQSFSNPEPTEREVWPHALVFAGLRWHVRAYDCLREDFVDLVLLRILDAKPLNQASTVLVQNDLNWNAIETVEIRIQPDLSDTQKMIVAAEYGMHKENKIGWVCRCEVRRSLLGYLLIALRLDDRSEPHPHICLADSELATRFRFL